MDRGTIGGIDMKCKLCSYRTPWIENMAAHYRKAHPEHMKRKKRSRSKMDVQRDELRGPMFTRDEVRRLKKLAHAIQNL